MSRRSSQADGPTVLQASPREARPGDELLWVSDEPSGPAHHALEVGLVMHDPRHDRVRVLSRDGTEHEFDAERVVVLLRHLQGLLEQSRATDPREHDRAAT
jgi:hypothetical protein